MADLPASGTLRSVISLWEQLFKRSTVVAARELASISYPQDDPYAEVRIYDGFLYTVGDACGFNRVKTTYLMKFLLEANAVTRLSLPTPKRPGIVQLNYRPTEADFGDYLEEVKRNRQNRIAPSRSDVLIRQNNDLTRKVIALENELTATKKELIDRIVQLEEAVRDNGRDSVGGSQTLP